MTWNEDLYDATLRRQVDLLRLGSGVSKRVNGILDATLKDLRQQVERRLGKTTGLDGASLKRMVELERAIVQIRSPAWNDVAGEWTRTALEVVLDEPEWAAGTLGSILPIKADFVAPPERTLRALATTRPFQGKNLKEWADSAQRSDLVRIQQQIRIGMVQGEGSRDIAARVFGARGATDITRNQADAVTRTVINHVSNAALREFYQENADLFNEEQIVATLDGRTTPVCRARDGERFPVGKGPIPPFHVRCRTVRVGVLDGEVIGERPFVAATERQLLEEYAEQSGIDTVKDRDRLPRGHKTRYDEFRRRRVRELTGQVPARRTYQEWLTGQTPQFQDDVLGPARGKLFREGGLTLDRFVSRQGDELTLEQIRERNQEAWKRAGMDRPKPSKPRGITELVGETQIIGNVPRELRSAVERTIERIAPAGTPVLNWLELHEATGFDVVAFGGVVRADGYYQPGGRRIRAATLLSAPARALADTNFGVSDTSTTRQQAVEQLIMHEYGHHVHISSHSAVDSVIRSAYDEAVPIRAGLHATGRELAIDFEIAPEGAPSRYGAHNHKEFWAESFAAYHSHRDWLRANKPVAFRMVEDVLGLLSQ